MVLFRRDDDRFGVVSAMDDAMTDVCDGRFLRTCLSGRLNSEHDENEPDTYLLDMLQEEYKSAFMILHVLFVLFVDIILLLILVWPKIPHRRAQDKSGLHAGNCGRCPSLDCCAYARSAQRKVPPAAEQELNVLYY